MRDKGLAMFTDASGGLGAAFSGALSVRAYAGLAVGRAVGAAAASGKRRTLGLRHFPL
jgi:hypothetical protein